MDNLIGILQAALGIGVLIFIHEAGHYLAARLAGVRVEVFSLGFGPRILGIVWRGTDYRLSAVPIGGYVRVAGEDPTQRQHLADDDLYAKGFGARALFFSGGVLMNLLFALVAFPIVFHRGVEFHAPVVGSVDPGGAAWRAGLEPGDRVLELDGKPMYSFDNLTVEVALAGESGADARIEREGEEFTVRLAPKYSERLGLFELGARMDVEQVTIADVAADGPASGSGLQRDDKIIGVDGEAVAPRDVPAKLIAIEPGAPLRLTVERDGQPISVEYSTGSRSSDTPRFGVFASRRRVAALRSGEELVEIGLQVGDIVLEVDGRPFWGTEEDSFTRGTGPLTVLVERDGVPFQLSSDLDSSGRSRLQEDVAFRIDDDRARIVPQPDSAAEQAGLLAGDIVEQIDGRAIGDWSDLVEAVQAAGATSVAVLALRDGRTEQFEITPRIADEADLGFSTVIYDRRDLFQQASVGGAIRAGFVASGDLVKQLYVTLKRIVTGDVAARNLGGIITISRVSYHYAQSGWERFIYFLAILSINLAFINVLPIPVLDGGHLMFLVIERIKGSPVSATVLNYSQILGLVFVLALLVFVTYHDILRLL